ncbi:MAG: response regulator [Betaproteobacteria bacterium]|nr:response regulator [Betaproteobacteria bacterium]
MAKILIVEDEAPIRRNLAVLLRAEGHEVVDAPDGLRGLAMARETRPDLIISDVMMPEMDGFELLQAIRADAQCAGTPFVLLTALGEKSRFRQAMNLGADDFLTKPYTADEVIEAVRVRLSKAKLDARRQEQRVLHDEYTLVGYYQKAFSGQGPELPDHAAQETTGEICQATVLFSDIRSFTSIAERLSAQEVAEMLNAYYQSASEPILGAGGRIAKFIGDAVMAIFVQGPGIAQHDHARMAVNAALGMMLAADRFRSWFAERYAGRDLPDFAIGIGLHTGEVLLCAIGNTTHMELTAIGDTVNIASRLESATKDLGWSIVGSEALVSAAKGAVETGRSTTVALKGRSGKIDVREVIGVRRDVAGAQAAPEELTEKLRHALMINSEITGRAVKTALARTVTLSLSLNTTDLAQLPSVPGYTLQRRIGEGGASRVYLAERERDGLPMAIKVLATDLDRDREMLGRFIQEYTILTSVKHPNIAQIFDQGLIGGLAYIALEYFPGGTVRSLMKPDLTEERALELIFATADALEAAHAAGVVHRDVKPENLMLRADGSLGLADFGVAKHLGGALVRTQQGHLVGTPYYVSPEAITGNAIDGRADLYSLGIVFFEMLTGKKPITGDTLEAVMWQHARGPIPTLPPRWDYYNPIMVRLLAKSPGERFNSAASFMAALRRLLHARRN